MHLSSAMAASSASSAEAEDRETEQEKCNCRNTLQFVHIEKRAKTEEEKTHEE
jgi:hypothetical protein